MLKKNRCVCGIEGNMQKAVLFFIFCVLLCEVTPKVPIRKENLLNKKAALSKQLSPNVPKWEDLAFKLHTKDKPSQNKSKTLMNLLKVVSAKEIDVPDTDNVKNDTTTNFNLDTNTTIIEIIKDNDAVHNKINQKHSVHNDAAKHNQFRRIKPNFTQTDATVIKTQKKYAANETIGAKLAFFLLKNAINTTKEKPNTPEVIAPTMIPIFKPMPSSTKNTIPQPLANELIRKDNFVPIELNAQQVNNLDNIDLNPNNINPFQNKAILNPLLGTEEVKDTHVKDAKHNIESKESIEQGFKQNTFNSLHNGLSLQRTITSGTPTNSLPSDITLSYVDPNNTHPEQDMNITPVQVLNPTNNGAVINQLNNLNIKPNSHQPIHNNEPQYQLQIYPPLPRFPNTNNNAEAILNSNLPIELSSQFIQEQSKNLEEIKSTLNQHSMTNNQNSFAINSNLFADHHGFSIIKNDYNVNQKEVAINPNILQDSKNNLYENHPLLTNKNNVAVNEHDLTDTKTAVNTNPINSGGISHPGFNEQAIRSKVDSKPNKLGFNLPCLKASDVLEDFVTTPNCCPQNKPVLNSHSEIPLPKKQCDKLISVDGDSNEDVAIVFKPKNISLLKFYGDLLKKITLTVLVPYHISKLTSQL